MALKTNLSGPPYNDDYDPTKDFYRILFQPGVTVQTRELNQLQTLFQAQIERFGDNIFSTGTIISGCNFIYLSPYQYIKIKDVAVSGNVATPSQYTNNHILNMTTGLKAYVIDYTDGYESTNPNLKTLYLSYLNTGFNSDISRFSSGDVLKIFNGSFNGIERIIVNNGGVGFTNTDLVLAISSIAVNVTSGTFSNGDYIVNGLGANLQITSIDSNTLSSVNQIILQLSPRTADLYNPSANALSWSLSNNSVITNIGTTATGQIMQMIGAGFQGKVITNGIGTIQSIANINKGVGYTSIPTVTIRSVNNSSGYSSVDITAQNYIDHVTVASVTSAVGNGYAFGINDGVIYQKGFFLRVEPQTVIVSKYDTNPTNVAVGFTTTENIITANMDTSLNDPSASPNNSAPGADRLQLVPKLVLTTVDDVNANSSIFPLCEWSEGQPFSVKQQTIYSKIGDTMAQRTYEQSGNFFIDPFITTTRSSIANTSSATFDVVVDPGTAYINGYRVSTVKNFVMSDIVDTTSVVQNNCFIELNYGNYININNVGGTFQFNTGDTIDLFDTAKRYLANTALIKAQNTASVGNKIGTARMRSFELSSGQPGTSSATYSLYLFDIQMNAGKNFGDVMSVHYNGTRQGIGDVVQQLSPTTNSYQTLIQGSNVGSLVFSTGSSGTMKNANNIIYNYRTIDTTLTVSNTGLIVKNISGTSNEFFPYTGTLTSGQMYDLYVVSTSVDLVSSANLTGTFTTSTTTANVVGSGTNFISSLQTGDYLYIYWSPSTYDLKCVSQIVNNTFLVLDSNCSTSNTSASFTRCFPAGVPIPLGYRSGLTANVNAGSNILTVNLGMNFTTTISEPVTLACNIQRNNITQLTKTPNRQRFVKINMANNAGNTAGPWCLGVPDIFRLRGVWIGNSAVDTTGTNYFKSFYIDSNQTVDYYDLGWLYQQPSSNVVLSTSQYLLCEFDYFTSSGAGFYDIVSYISSNTAQVIATDSLPLSNLTSSINTFEIPEFFTDSGIEVDLINIFDFRPSVSATVSPTITAVSAPVDPSSTLSFSLTEHKFPVPSTPFQYNMETYLARMDSLYVDQTGLISYTQGTDGIPPVVPSVPAGTMRIADILIPPYPVVPINRSTTLTEIMNTGVLNQKYATGRTQRQLLQIINNINSYQSKVYDMSDVASMDRRLAAVEYYVSLNSLESNVASMVIPSSSDTSVNRFKFGFFVDDFSTFNYMDLSNPQFRSSLENGDIVPSKLIWELSFGGSGDLSSISVPIISQENATIGTLTDPTIQPNCAITVANTVAYQLMFRNITDSSGLLAPQGNSIDTVNITLADATHMANAASQSAADNFGGDYWSSTPGGYSVELFFYCKDSPTLFQIYQGDTLIADSTSAINLTATEITNLTGSQSNYWFDDQTSLYMKNFVNTGSGYVLYAGKIGWNYNGIGGQNITIKSINGQYARNWKWVLSYPINGEAAGCTPPYQEYFYDWSGCTNAMQAFYDALLSAEERAAAAGQTLQGTVQITGIGGGYAVASNVTYQLSQLWNSETQSIIPVTDLGTVDHSYVSVTVDYKATTQYL